MLSPKKQEITGLVVYSIFGIWDNVVLAVSDAETEQFLEYQISSLDASLDVDRLRYNILTLPVPFRLLLAYLYTLPGANIQFRVLHQCKTISAVKCKQYKQ